MFSFIILISSSIGCILQTNSFNSEEIEIEKSTSITAVGTNMFLIQDESCDYFKVSADGSLDELAGECDYDDLRALFQFPNGASQTDGSPTLIACRKNGKKCVQLGTNVKYTVQDGGDGCHDSVNWIADDVESAFGIQQNDKDYMVALIGTSLITYEFNGLLLESVGCTSVNTSFTDLSGISLLGDNVVIASQTSNLLWVGTGNGIPFALSNGQEFALSGSFEKLSGVVLQNAESSTGNLQGVLSDSEGENSLFQFDLACSSQDYYASPMPLCALGSQFLITKDSCEAAAVSLGLSDIAASEINNSERVRGCYYKESAASSDSKLYFNSDLSGPISETDTSRSSICSALATGVTFIGWGDWKTFNSNLGLTDNDNLGTVNAAFDSMCASQFPGTRAVWENELLNGAYRNILNYPVLTSDDTRGSNHYVGAKEHSIDDSNQWCYQPDTERPEQGIEDRCSLTGSLGFVACVTDGIPTTTSSEPSMSTTTLSSSEGYEYVGSGWCRPGDCDVLLDANCRVNGFFADGSSPEDCVQTCSDTTKCTGFAISNSTSDFPNRCYVYGDFQPETTPTDWTTYPQSYTTVEQSNGQNHASCYRSLVVSTTDATTELTTTEVFETTEVLTTVQDTTSIEESTTESTSTTMVQETTESSSITVQETTSAEETTSTTRVPSTTTEEISVESTSSEETTLIVTTEIVEPSDEVGETSEISEMTTSEAPGFSLSSTSRCQLLSQVISTVEDCLQAAQDLGLSDITVQQIQNVDRPYGCYFKEDAGQENGKLWLNTHPDALSILDDNSRQSLCHGDGAVLQSFSPQIGTFALILLIFLF